MSYKRCLRSPAAQLFLCLIAILVSVESHALIAADEFISKLQELWILLIPLGVFVGLYFYMRTGANDKE